MTLSGPVSRVTTPRAIAVGAFVRAGTSRSERGAPTQPSPLRDGPLTVEPWSEDSYRVLIAALLTAGDHAGGTHARAM